MTYRRSDRHAAGIWAPLLLTAGLLVLELLSPREGGQYIGVLTAVPLLAAALVGPLATGLVGLVATVAGFAIGFTQQIPGDESDRHMAFTAEQLGRVGFIAAATVLAVVVSATRTQRAAQLRRLTSVADAAQRAILRPIPPAVGPVDCASVYLSAASEASIGGDLVEVLDTPFGVRAVVGDVRGKGMEAVRLAGQVLGSFREVAWTVREIRDVAVPLDRAVRRDADGEDFVTAVLVQMTWDGVVTICSCGHPPPFVVDGGGGPAKQVDVDPAPPLGMLGGSPEPVTVRLGAGQRLVLATDGLLEARRGLPPVARFLGRFRARQPVEFLDVEEVLGRNLASGDLEAGLRGVIDDVRTWTRRQLADDLAVLVLQVRRAGPRRHRRRA